MSGDLLKIATIDFGTTKAVLSPADGEKTRIQYHKTVNPELGLAYLDSDALSYIVNGLLGNLSPQWDALGIAGLGHSLVVNHPPSDKAIYIGDDPSLVPKNGIIDKWAPHYESGSLKATSNLNKLAAILENPEILLHLFGHNGFGFQDTQFSALLSYIAAKVLQRSNLDIFPDETDDFKPQELAALGLTVAGLLGLSTHQLQFYNDHFTTTPDDRLVCVMKDFRPDTKVINMLFKEGLIPPNSWVFETDSVLKRIFQTPVQTSKQIEGVNYDTMRMMGNTGPTYLRPMMHQRGMLKTDNPMHEMFTAYNLALTESTMPTSMFFNPRANNGLGEFWHLIGNTWNKVSPQEIVEYPENDFWEMVRAMGWGIGASMYEQVPPNSDVVLTGGLMCIFDEIQTGWGHVFTHCAPESSPLWWLKMADSSTSMQIVIKSHLGMPVDLKKQIPIESIGRGKGDINKWLSLKTQIYS